MRCVARGLGKQKQAQSSPSSHTFSKEDRDRQTSARRLGFFEEDTKASPAIHLSKLHFEKQTQAHPFASRGCIF
jgi:hypothetical protein